MAAPISILVRAGRRRRRYCNRVQVGRKAKKVLISALPLHFFLKMPIHFLSEALSGFVALETIPVVLAGIFALIFLKNWSAGLDLLSRLDRAATAPEKEIDDDKGGLLVKKRKVKPRDLHGTVALVVVSLTIVSEKFSHLTHYSFCRVVSPLKDFSSARNYPRSVHSLFSSHPTLRLKEWFR